MIDMYRHILIELKGMHETSPETKSPCVVIYDGSSRYMFLWAWYTSAVYKCFLYTYISVYGLATCTLGGFPIKIKVHDLKTLHLLHAKQQLSVYQLRQWQPPKLGKIWDIATMHGKMLIYHIYREREDCGDVLGYIFR